MNGGFRRGVRNHGGARKLVLAGAAVVLVALAFLLLPTPASAAVDITGDWVISSAVSYSNEVITVTGTNGTVSTDGNITITAPGSLSLTNCTVIMASGNSLTVNGTLTAVDTTFDGRPWFFEIEGTVSLDRVRIQNATRAVNSTVGATYVNSTNVSFNQVTWNASAGASYIHLNRPIDFTDNILESRVTLLVEVNPTFAGTAVQVARNAFDVGYSDLYGVLVRGGPIGSPSSFDIHDNTFHDAYVAITIGRADPQASYTVRNNFVNNTGWGSLLEIGDTFGSERFDGSLTATNNTIYNSVRGVRLYGNAARTTVVYVDRLVTINASTGVIANDGTIVLTNSTIGQAGTSYDADSDGHIKVYNTNDLALDSTNPGTNGSVEHYAFLNIVGFSWQGNVPFVGDLLTLRNTTGVVNLVLDPSNWTASQAVVWGVYPSNTRVDNRDLRPVVVDGGITFDCGPSQFYFGDGMAPTTIQCQDTRSPVIAVSRPVPSAYVNLSTFSMAGSMSEVGSGVGTFDYSLDNVSFTPITPGANGSAAWTVDVGPLADGSYSVTVRAADRTGNVAYLTVFPIRIDTVFPVIALGSGEARDNATRWLVTGSSEPFAQLTVRRSYGWNQTVTLPADGQFNVLAPIDEGQNIFTIQVVDRAGNGVSQEFVIHLDTLAPTVVALMDGMPVSALWTGNSTVQVSGVCEAGATVSANGVAVLRTGTSFETDLALVPGRNDVDVSCTDSSGNSGHWFGFAFFDDQPPALTAAVDGAVVLPDGRFLVTSALVAIAGNVVDGGSGIAAVSVGGNPVVVSGAGDLTVSVDTPEGQTVVEVMAVDRVGNTATVTLTILRDSVAPTASFAWAPSGSAIVEVGGVMTTASEQAVLEVTLDEPATVMLAGATHDLPEGVSQLPVTLVSGPNQFTVSVKDAAGNGPPDTTVQINRDATAPEITIYTPRADALLDVPAVEVTGKAEPGASVKVAGQDVSVSATGEFHLFIVLQEGSNTITVDASDALGNTNSSSVTVTYHAPVAPPTTAPAGGLEIPMLIAGLAVGLGVGAVAMRGRSGAGRRVDEAGPPPAPEAPANAREPPHEMRGPKGPKGPRGPLPP